MKDLHLGIDGGQKGGLAALSPVKGLEPIAVTTMPMMKVGGVPQMNVRALVDWILALYPTGDVHVWLEKCPKHARSQAAMRSQAINYGRMLMLFEARFPHMIVHRVACGNALDGWHRAMLYPFEKGESKARALEVAREIWPRMNWPMDRNENVRDGIIDAALIAEFGRRKTEGESKP